MPETLTKKEWRKINGRLKQHKKLDAVSTEMEWVQEQGIDDPALAEYERIRNLKLDRPAENAEKELERLRLILRRHTLERELEREGTQVFFNSDK